MRRDFRIGGDAFSKHFLNGNGFILPIGFARLDRVTKAGGILWNDAGQPGPGIDAR